MAAQKPLVVKFSEIDKSDLPLVGGKGANLGEMVKAGFPVPDGFAITVHAYDLFLQENNLNKKILDVIKVTDVDRPDQLQSAQKTIEKLVIGSEIPKILVLEIADAYHKLSGKFRNIPVAVRSSATAEDLPNASFAGQQATYLNIIGHANLLKAVRDCFASLFTARAIYYRAHNKINTETTKISVMVQKMIQSEASGVMFTLDPVTNDKDRVIIEAVWGLGELIVQGSVVPDRYVVQKDTFTILSKEISDQVIQLTKKGAVTKELRVPKNKIGVQKISDSEIVALAKIADKLQKHYYFPQDIEWAKDSRGLFITQTRPVTTSEKKERGKQKGDFVVTEAPILSGLAASPGMGTGPVVIVTSPKEINKVGQGDVLVSKMTSPDFVPAMKKASAIVTDEGGQTAHAAIVSRELGIPCVVGTKEATQKLKDGMIVSVDGTKGQVYLGARVLTATKSEESFEHAKEKTATKLYVNLAEPESVNKVSRLNIDGVGLLRAEFMIANIGIHPKEAIKQKKQDLFVDQLVKDLSTFCEGFGDRPVVYRATDFKTNEYRSLKSGALWEPDEPNPMLGFRGAFRYIANPEVFTLELRAIKKVRERHKNLWLMIPFVRSPEELRMAKRIVASQGLLGDTTFRLWMMVELPVNVIMLNDFIDVGIDGVSVGSNDLTMLLLGTDRDNAEVASAFDENSEVLAWALKRTIRLCKKRNVTVSICGQAPSSHDDLVEKLVKLGVTSISVNPDAISRVRNLIFETEKAMLKR